jgi:hypothetical protein
MSESVSVTPSRVIEASTVLCSVFMTRVSQRPISLRSGHPLSTHMKCGVLTTIDTVTCYLVAQRILVGSGIDTRFIGYVVRMNYN